MMEQEYKYMVCTRCFTFNHAPFIVDAMNGFTMQETTFPVITIIVDDASTDGEPDVIRQYLVENFQAPYNTEETDDYYLICANHTTNPNCTFVVFLLKYNHYSIKKSKMPYLSEWLDNAKYIAICEGDDYWIDSLKLQKQVDFLEGHPDYSMSHTRYIVFKTSINHFDDDKHRNERCLKMNNDGIVNPEFLIHGYTIRTLTVVFRSCIRNKLSLMDSFLYKPGVFLMGDTQLWFGLSRFGKIHYLPEITSVYRKHEGSATMQKSFKKNIRFTLSSWERNYYLSYKYDFSDEEKTRSASELGRYLAIYRILDSTYEPPIAEVLPVPYYKGNAYGLFIHEYWNFFKAKILRSLNL